MLIDLFSLQLLTFCVPHICVVVIMCQWKFLFSSSIFGVLYASYFLVGIISRLRKFSSMTLLKIFSVLLTCVSFLLLFLSFLDFYLLRMSICFGYFVPEFFRYNMLFDWSIDFFYRVFNATSCIVLERLASTFSFAFLNFYFQSSPILGFLYWFYFHFQTLNCVIHLLPLFFGLIHIFFKTPIIFMNAI